MPLQNIGTNSDGSPIQGLPLGEHPEIIQISQDLTSNSAILQTVQQNLVNHNHDGQYAPIGSTSSGASNIAIVREVKPLGGYATNFSGGFAWTPRDLNSLTTNGVWGIALAAKTITLPAGTYWIEWNAPCMPARAVYHSLFSPSLDVFVGRYQFADFTDISQISNDNYFNGATLFSSSSAQTLQLRGAYNYAFSGYELVAAGLPRSLNEEVYSWVKIIKI